MKHHGRAAKAAAILIAKVLLAVIPLALVFMFGWPGHTAWVLTVLGGLLLLFIGFVLWFFRDPEPTVPKDRGIVVAPAHGLVDVVDQLGWPEDSSRKCQRISIFLSIFNVHVQQAPATGKVVLVRRTKGLFLNALKTESAEHNENVLVLLEASDPPGTILGVRLIAGLIARRIIPWAKEGETVARGERISLIQFGSRVDLYLPLDARLEVKMGDRVVGGQTVVARLSGAN